MIYFKRLTNKLIFNNINNIKKGIIRRNGKNNQGRITIRHRGNGIKTKKIQINNNIIKYYNNYKLKYGQILKIIKNYKYTTTYIAYLKLYYQKYNNKLIKYTSCLLTNDLKLNDKIYNFVNIDKNNYSILYNEIKLGNILCLKNIPIGTFLNNIELHFNKGSQLIKAAGTYSQFIKKDIKNNKAFIKLRSGEIKQISLQNRAIIGLNSNLKHHTIKKKNAGENRNKGIRPHVRGVAMNIVDHPHGSSGGKTSGGRCSVSPWGKLTKGKKTVYKK